MKLRGDIHLLTENNSIYLKLGTQIYELAGLEVEKIKAYWDSILNSSEDKYANDTKFIQFKSFLQQKGAFKDNCVWDPYLKQYGIPIDNFDKKLSSKKISVVGDSDLVNDFSNKAKNIFNIVNYISDECDYGVIIARSHKTDKILKFNSEFIKNNIETFPLLVQPFNMFIGPLIIPNETPCLNCVFNKEQKNSIYSHQKNLFNKIQDREDTEIIKPLLNQGIDFIIIELIKRIMFHENIPIEQGLLNVILEISFLDSRIEEHNILKDPDCNICYPPKNINVKNIWQEKIL